MNNFIPKIIAAHDLSGMGRASLGTVIPVLSVMGSYVCPLPTAVLSTITGVFENYEITDLTDQMIKTINHWNTLDIKFDYIYSGFLGSESQVDVILNAQEMFKSYLIVDPVFADDGKLYKTMSKEMVENMRKLVSVANIITPNATEAQFLLDCDKAISLEDYKKQLIALSDMGPEKVVITSCHIENETYVLAYDRLKNRFIDLKYDYIPLAMHGTGDLFTSVLVGAIARGDGFEDALQLAENFVKAAIEITVKNNIPLREGVLIEKILTQLQ